MRFAYHRRWIYLASLSGILGAPIAAHASGHYECDHRVVAETTRQCPDGSIPMYLSEPLQSEPPRQQAPPARRHDFPDEPQLRPDQYSGNPASLIGMWQTNVSSATWTGPSDRWGYATQHSSVGALAGGLSIRTNRTFVWNSAYCARNRGWSETGDPERPIVLHCVDDGNAKDWSVALDERHPGHIFIWDEWGVVYNGKFVRGN